MASWRPPHDDLVLRRLLNEARPLASGADGANLLDRLQAIPRSPRPNSITHLFRAPGPSLDALSRAADQFGGLIDGGEAAIVQLHAAPLREVATPDGSTALLSAVRDGDDVVVWVSTWQVRRLPNLAPTAVEFVDIDEFRASLDFTRLESLLVNWAAATGFNAEHPSYRAACVVVPPFDDEFADLDLQLRAVAAVSGVELDFFVARHDPRDARDHGTFERMVLSNRYQLLLTVSDPRAKWVWRLGGRFKETNREHRALPTTRVVDATTELASVAARVAKSLPDRPTEYWGSAALTRIEARVGESFALSQRARGHLAGNRYPDPERMLNHLERLADVAESWRQRKVDGDAATERLEDWVFRDFELKIALHDGGIPDRDAFFQFDGRRLCNRPHLKVDDFASPSDCGRIYFGLDERPEARIWRLVVDHIGLHDRS